MKHFISPCEYISGYNILLTEKFNLPKKNIILSNKTILPLVTDFLSKIENFELVEFEGECSLKEIKRIQDIVKNGNYDAIIGIGGGKILDTAKAVGYLSKIKIITIPTIASNCAAWSSHSAIYTDTGIAYEYFNIHKNPDLLIVDKRIIFEAPLRYIKAGIADTIAKWIESNTSSKKFKNISENVFNLEIALNIAKYIYDLLINISEKALEDINNKNFTKEVDLVIDSIIIGAGLVGGIGGETCRAVAAHAVNNGLTVIPEIYRNNLHGEAVAFGTIVQLILDKKDYHEVKKLIKFYKKIGLPFSPKELGYDFSNDSMLTKIVNRTIYSGDTMKNLPYEVNFDLLYNTFKQAENLIEEI